MSAATTFSMRSFPARDDLLDVLCAELVQLLGRAVDSRGRASLAVAGGSTPIPLFERLARRALPWHSVSVTLTDERWVPSDDPASNEGLLRNTLARECAAAVGIVGLRTIDADPEAAIGPATERLAQLHPPLDAIVLGAGEDGHIASLFPGAVDTALALDPRASARYVAVSPPSSAVAPGNRRLSMTLSALVDCERLLLLVTGAEKKSLIDRVAAGDAETRAWPLAAVLRQAVKPVEVWWAP